MNLPELRFERVGLEDVLEFYRDLTRLNIYVDWDAVGGLGVTRRTEVTFVEKNIPFDEALQGTLDAVAGKPDVLGFRAVGNIVMVGVAGNLPDPTPTVQRWREELRTILPLDRRLPEVRFDGVKLRDVIEFMSDVNGVDIAIVESEPGAADPLGEIPIHLRLRYVTVADSLWLILHQAGAGKSELDLALVEGKLVVMAVTGATTRP